MKIDNNELKGIIGTVVAHAVAVLILLLVVLKAPDPVGESGMDVLLGDATVSRGNAQQYQYTEVAAAPQPVPQPQDVLQSTAPKPVEEPAITQDSLLFWKPLCPLMQSTITRSGAMMLYTSINARCFI